MAFDVVETPIDDLHLFEQRARRYEPPPTSSLDDHIGGRSQRAALPSGCADVRSVLGSGLVVIDGGRGVATGPGDASTEEGDCVGQNRVGLRIERIQTRPRPVGVAPLQGSMNVGEFWRCLGGWYAAQHPTSGTGEHVDDELAFFAAFPCRQFEVEPQSPALALRPDSERPRYTVRWDEAR